MIRKIEKLGDEFGYHQVSVARNKFNEIIEVLNELVEEQWSRYCSCQNPYCKSPHWPNRETKTECKEHKRRSNIYLFKYCPDCGVKL